MEVLARQVRPVLKVFLDQTAMLAQLVQLGLKAMPGRLVRKGSSVHKGLKVVRAIRDRPALPVSLELWVQRVPLVLQALRAIRDRPVLLVSLVQ